MQTPDSKVHARNTNGKPLCGERRSFMVGPPEEVNCKRCLKKGGGETPFGKWTALCDAAMLAPDTLRPDDFVAARLAEKSGRVLTAAEVGSIRDAAWEWIRSRPSIHVGTLHI
jgi:hypothetical protein